MPHCDSKAIVDQHIFDNLPELAKKTTFLWVGYYASNLAYFPLCKVEYFVSGFPRLFVLYLVRFLSKMREKKKGKD